MFFLVQSIYHINATMVQIILLHNDLLSLIRGYLTFIDKLNHQSACKQFRLIKITDLYNIDPKHLKALDKMNLCKYVDVIQLQLTDNPKITTVNHLTGSFTKLKRLVISEGCGVGDDGIQGCTNLENLNAGSNNLITTLNHLKMLRVLDISETGGVKNIGIRGCTDLVELTFCENPSITKFNHLKKLRIING